MSIKKVLNSAVEVHAQKTALVYKETEISFIQLQQNSYKLAQLLAKNGISKGDKVGIYLPNCPEFAYSYLAIFLLGAVGVPLDFMLKEDELISCLSHSESKVLIALEKKEGELSSLAEAVPSLNDILLINSEEFQSGFQSSVSDAIETAIEENDPALIMYTSGTTGKPKGILLNYKHLEGSPEAMKHFVDLTDQDVKLAAIPLSHIGGFIYLQNCIHFGITVVLMDRFNPFEFLQLVTKHKVTCFHIVPPMYNAILTLKQIESFDLSSLRFVVVFGAPSSPEILERFHKYCPNAKLLNGWGMTETCPPNTVTPLDSSNIASVGKPSKNCKIRIVDEQGQDVECGKVGEIVISGWIVMQEYYKDPEETARIKKEDGLYTGDLGRFDDQGFLYIVGRKKEMIKVAGQLVYSPEVEAALHKHEDVVEVAVVGVEDKMKGEAIKAFVVLKEESQLKVEDIRYFARQHLANFKVPSQIELRDNLPKNRTGKIDKNALKDKNLSEV